MNATAISVAPTLSQVPSGAPLPDPDQTAARRAEQALLARLRRGEEGAFDELVRKNHSALVRMAMGYVGGREIAEEVVQDTWIAVIDALDRFEGRSSLRTWIFGILIHKAKDRGVRESRHFTFSDLESVDDDSGESIDPARFHACGDRAGAWALPPHPWEERTPERLLASKQAFAALDRAVGELPRGLREVLVLKDIEGVDTKDICALLRITETNLYVRLHRARERVREAVAHALGGEGTTAALRGSAVTR